MISPGNRRTEGKLEMRSTSVICAMAMSLWSVAIAGKQSPAANALPGPLRAHLSEDRFQLVTSLRGLPLGVREELPTLFRSNSLDIAEPGAAFRATDVILEPNLPTRRLVLAACSIDHCLIYYERGGIAHSWHVALFHWTPAATRFEWGGIAPSGLRTFDDLRKTALSGAIRASDSW
jgi:hypothetical protein